MQAAVLGLIQGLAEFLPISSSGHLIFLPKLFGWTDQGLAFDVVVHLGTLLAVLVYFRKRLLCLTKSLLDRNASGLATARTSRRLAIFILLSVIPAGILGLWFGDWLEAQTRSATVVAASLIGWAAVLAVADRFGKSLAEKRKAHALEEITWPQLVVIACSQAVALIPGTSRSGITMTAGLFSGLDKKSAAEFSFLMSIPVITLAGLAKVIDLGLGGGGELGVAALASGFITSAFSGLVAIWGLVKIIQRWSFLPFVMYRIAVGLLILFVLVKS